MKKTLLVLLMGLAAGCAALKKDNEAHETQAPISEEVKAQRATYLPLVGAQLDAHGLVVMGGSIGDSALFSCLARAAGAASFDPAILFVGGKPLRHPDIAPGTPGPDGRRGTPISHDMVDGHLWCLYDLARRGERDHAADLLRAMIEFGKQHAVRLANAEVGWMFCTDQDKVDYAINEADWYGRCFMPAGIVKDIYRVAKYAGVDCDDDCKNFMLIGPNLPSDSSGFERHLAVIGTVRNGLVEGAINDNSLRLLEHAAAAEPRNALYLAAHALFVNGEQGEAFAALQDHALFPADVLPTSVNYCTEYLFQRDQFAGGTPNPDWLPCTGDVPAGSRGRGVDWLFAAAMALGDVR